MRNPVACVSCRSAKQKCIHQDRPPCDRCKQSGRAELCEFPAPGTSAIHRKPKRPRLSEDAGETPPSNPASATSIARHSSRNDAHVPTGTNAAAYASPSAASALLDGLDPFELLTDEVKNSYLRCSYKWSFHHTPTLLRRIRDRTLEPWMVWAILALAIRFVQEPPAPFSTQTAASNAYAAHARQILQQDLETPSISRVQALLMLTGHDWGAGNGRRAWIYLGMAIRLVEVMDLTRETGIPRNRVPTREEFIEAEVRRRTAWTCFLMDSLLSGGKGRKRSLTAADMSIQLPCEREDFVFGEPKCTPQLDNTQRMPPVALPVGDIGIIGYSMRAANIWGKVARWACSEDLKSELPWSSTSQLQHLIYELEGWKSSLPQRLQYDLFTLHSHNAVEQGQAYCYMHCIHFMSYMFLHRAYLPVLGPQQNGAGPEETPNSYHEHGDMWKRWEKSSRKALFKDSVMVLEMLEEMRTFGVYFLRGLVPWIGFTIYTAVGAMLYSFNFPSNEDDPRWQEKARKSVIQGCNFLKEMKTQWPMAETWFDTIRRMQAYYRSILGPDGPASPEERQALRHAMIDYGALQPSPVQKPTDSHRANDNIMAARSPSQHPNDRKPMIANITNPQITSPMPVSTPTPNGYTNGFPWNTPPAVPPLEADETFNLDSFDLTNEELEAMMVNATQDFWASFPGEVGVGY
ncbi:Fungal-trans multi-domain protein [Pyrenophora teres f. maculata]|nr:Fungal-trans multi-domain protein [Pyrenophora teres f. maculata]